MVIGEWAIGAVTREVLPVLFPAPKALVGHAQKLGSAGRPRRILAGVGCGVFVVGAIDSGVWRLYASQARAAYSAATA